MYKINKTGSTFKVSNYPWDVNGYKPETAVTISYDDNGFKVHFVSFETKLSAKRTVNNTDVCADSCMELFMQFDPENDKHYINFEINPIGTAYNALNLKRGDTVQMSDEDIALLDIQTKVFEDRWEIDYQIPVSYIKKFVPTYQHREGNVIRGNFYKCGDETEFPHYGCFADIIWEKPDFHRPEFFAEFVLGE